MLQRVPAFEHRREDAIAPLLRVSNRVRGGPPLLQMRPLHRASGGSSALFELQAGVGHDAQGADPERLGASAHREDVSDVVRALEDREYIERPLLDDRVQARESVRGE